jgi:hypothetical protein
MSNDDRNKAIMKEAIDEWLDKQFAKFGKWTVFGISSALFVGFIKMVLAGWWVGLWKH